MTLPSADELLTGVSKKAHGSVDEDSENKRIDWCAVGTSLRHYLPVVSARETPDSGPGSLFAARPARDRLRRRPHSSSSLLPRSYVL